MTTAQRLDADIALLTVTPDVAEWGVDAVVREFSPSVNDVQWMQEYLAARAADVAEVSDRTVSYEVRSGVPRDVLLEFARELRPVVIVMATHGRGPVTRAWLGSVADAVQRAEVGPVMLVHPGNGASRRPVLTEHPDLGRILVPMDGSRRAEATFRFALQLGNGDTTWILMQFLSVPFAPFTGSASRAASGWPPVGATAGGTWLPGLMDAMRAEADEYLSGIADPPRRRGLDIETHVDADGSPAPGILGYAGEAGVELIVIGTHGRGGGLPHTGPGSVADKVARSAPCPVLLVPDGYPS